MIRPPVGYTAMHKHLRRGLGFTLLEAIVALVLIGGAGMALFSLD